MSNGFLRDFVQIIGITDPSEFPVIGAANPHTQFTVQERLTIPAAKPDVEQINTLLIEAVITNTRNIFTPVGVKVVIEGILRQKVIYTADVPEQSVHSAHFEQPFCTFIDIPLNVPTGVTVPAFLASLGISINDILAGPVNILIEDVEIHLLDPRTVSKCVVLFAWTTLNPVLLLPGCTCAFGATLTGDVTIGLETVTASLGVNICQGCNPLNNSITLTIPLVILPPITLTVNASQITDILCSADNSLLTITGTGTVLGLAVSLVGFTLTIDVTAGTATLVLTNPLTNTELLNITLPLGGALITSC